MEALNLGSATPSWLDGLSLDGLSLDPLPPETRQRLLRFALGTQDSALLPLEQITEILRVDVAEILSVPEVPDGVLGICNWRGEMLWLIDLCHIAGYGSPFQQEPLPTALMVMVVQFNQQSIGIGVPQVNEIELHDLQQIQPVLPGLVAPELLPLVLGLLPAGNDVVLNIKAIVEYPLWQKHQRECPAPFSA